MSRNVGWTLMEVLVAMTLFGIITASLAPLANRSVQLALDANKRGSGTQFLQETTPAFRDAVRGSEASEWTVKADSAQLGSRAIRIDGTRINIETPAGNRPFLAPARHTLQLIREGDCVVLQLGAPDATKLGRVVACP